MNKAYKYVSLASVSVLAVLISLMLSGSFKLQPTAADQAVSGEQQGIAAVRLAKLSIVDIIGVSSQSQTDPADPSGGLVPKTVIYGTGFVLDASGMIVSNNHVVQDPSLNYTVILADGAEYPAQIVGTDKYDDVALLQIPAANLIPAKLGDSSALEPGQSVFAIGDSLGQYQYTVTRGVVSAVDRSVYEGGDATDTPATQLHNLIQTDASINPGNSGGPLVNINGEVIGMNTLIDTGGSGLGFAVPANTIKDAVQQLKTFGKVSRPYLGVRFLDLDPGVQIAKKLSVNSGALVVQVQDGSPAANAGVQANDIITAVNDLAVNPNHSLNNAIQSFNAGSQVTLHILRNGQSLQISVILGQLQ